jgi:hypothetical protein
LGWGEKLGIFAPLMLTPTPPSPVEGEGTAQRLTTKFVPNSIEPFPLKGEGSCFQAMRMEYLPPVSPLEGGMIC